MQAMLLSLLDFKIDYKLRKILAIQKYIRTPRMSIEVVTKGPVATAASISKRFRAKGMNVPTVADMAMEKK